ncbi:TPA: hypothetical protein NJZ05_002579 [Vibrio parahaemolyticus]|uniref:DNA sulfur modification protein DndB n=1 Tax=Vibrio sp. 2-1(7) TaxID=2591011 RepID=UPI0014821CE6|nr:DNA sulfur modification protein DndB [Vibrio sp. 2-1(7)]NNN66544.1 hypothetical protein [Vibrio sp. 2-1(7)]HCG5114200.1 hypothetical protein [Vibrio parahaemolyticus]
MSDDLFEGLDDLITKFEHSVIGTKGEFWSSGGPVEFIMTNAKLSLLESEDSAKLTRQLYPVRELLDFNKLDFDQLLQRDLDDHRVATELIPYLLEHAHQGPSFFPPIVAALLPFKKKSPIENFPSIEPTGVEKNDGAFWSGEISGTAYKFQNLVTKSGSKAPFNMSRLQWNESGARLVVLDGQHRAMAMLAIARTITDSWGDSGGEKYKYFYESRIKKIIDKLGGMDWVENNIEKIEFPVCLIKFKDDDNKIDHHDSARKLFVDVNQNARRPSESRIILLSDNDLLNIFTRKTLNEIRNESCSFPIYAIEYDYPGSNKKTHSTRPVKWSSIVNIEMLRAAVVRTVFGPSKFIDSVDSKIGGKPNWTDKNQFMGETLQLESWFPRQVEFEGLVFERDNIKKDYFPKNKLNDFVEKYNESWGKAIITVFEKFLPFQAHSRALNELLESWNTYEVHSSLAKEAISKGQGMYWTLKDSYDHWKENGKKGIDDTSKAWDAIDSKKDDFYVLLANNYLGKSNKECLEKSRSFYEIFNTYANFVGLFLMLSTLVRSHGIKGRDIPIFVNNVIELMNSKLQASNGKLKLFLLRDIDYPINRIKGMDSPDSGYFRYFWLELLLSSLDDDTSCLEYSKVNELVTKARCFYLNYLIRNEINLIKSNVSLSQWKNERSDLELDALNKAKDHLQQALSKYFNMNKSDFETWFELSFNADEADEADELEQVELQFDDK